MDSRRQILSKRHLKSALSSRLKLEREVSQLDLHLAPASLRKEGPAYDFPIALGVLAAVGQLPVERLTACW